MNNYLSIITLQEVLGMGTDATFEIKRLGTGFVVLGWNRPQFICCSYLVLNCGTSPLLRLFEVKADELVCQFSSTVIYFKRVRTHDASIEDHYFTSRCEKN